MSEHNPISAAKLWLVLARASSAIGTYIERSLGQQGFCLTDFMVLEALLHKGPLTISAIGEKVLLASASMTSAIDRLEERGLVHRSPSAEDRRVRLVALTCEGRAFIGPIFEQHASDLEAISTAFSQQERQVLYAALKKIGFAARAATSQLSSASARVRYSSSTCGNFDVQPLREAPHEAPAPPPDLSPLCGTSAVRRSPVQTEQVSLSTQRKTP